MKKKILIIEDQQDLRENIAEMLQWAGYEVFQASNGKEGIQKALEKKPDLILCDIMMPVMDGYEVLQQLSLHPSAGSVPFLFLTAKTEREDWRKGMEMGADDYITKPFTDMELLRAIEVRLKKHQIGKKNYGTGLEDALNFFKDLKDLNPQIFIPEHSRSRKFPAGSFIYSEGSSPEYLYLVKSGRIKIFSFHEYGKEFIHEILIPGNFFGYTALINHEPYKESAEAMEDSEVYYIPRELFFELLFNSHEISSQFIRFLSRNISEKESKITDLAYSSVRKRTAHVLLHLMEKNRKASADPYVLKISREELAQIVGTATESVIRVLSDFKKEDLLETRGSRLLIKDEKKLMNLQG